MQLFAYFKISKDKTDISHISILVCYLVNHIDDLSIQKHGYDYLYKSIPI